MNILSKMVLICLSLIIFICVKYGRIRKLSLDLSCQTHPIHGRQTLHNLQGQLLSTFQFFIFVLNSFKDVQFLYSDCN